MKKHIFGAILAKEALNKIIYEFKKKKYEMK